MSRAGSAWQEHVVDTAARRLDRKRPAWTDLEEIRQECWAALLVVASETSSRDAAYVVRAVQNRVVDRWRTDGELHRSMLAENIRAREAGRSLPWGATSLDQMAADAHDGWARADLYVPVQEPGYERVEELTDAARMWARVMPLLSERERSLFVGLFVDGRQMHEMAVDFGISESRVSQIVRRALQRVRLALGLPEPAAYDLQWLHHDHSRPRKRFPHDLHPGRQHA